MGAAGVAHMHPTSLVPNISLSPSSSFVSPASSSLTLLASAAGEAEGASIFCHTSIVALIAAIVVVNVLRPTVWRRKIPPVVVVILRSNNGTSCRPPPPSLLCCSSPPAPLCNDISAAVFTASSSLPCPLSLCHLTPVQIAPSAMTLPSLHPPSSPQPPPHHQTTTSSLAMTTLLLV